MVQEQDRPESSRFAIYPLLVRAVLVLSVASIGLGLTTCSVASCFSVLNFEPPHPHWTVRIADTAGDPERAKFDSVTDSDYDVSIHPRDSACTLKVIRADGKVLGRSTGGLCLVSTTGRKGESWKIEATSSATDAEIQVAIANPLFPEPLDRVALGGALVSTLGLLGMVISLVARKRIRHLTAG
jgi:hypothetical protein